MKIVGYTLKLFFKEGVRSISNDINPNSRTNRARRQTEQNLSNSLYNSIIGKGNTQSSYDSYKKQQDDAWKRWKDRDEAAWHAGRERETRGTNDEIYHKNMKWNAQKRSKY